MVNDCNCCQKCQLLKQDLNLKLSIDKEVVCQECGLKNTKVFMNKFDNGKIICKDRDACEVRQGKTTWFTTQYV
jgi:hypothetical protein